MASREAPGPLIVRLSVMVGKALLNSMILIAEVGRLKSIVLVPPAALAWVMQ